MFKCPKCKSTDRFEVFNMTQSMEGTGVVSGDGDLMHFDYCECEVDYGGNVKCCECEHAGAFPDFDDSEKAERCEYCLQEHADDELCACADCECALHPHFIERWTVGGHRLAICPSCYDKRVSAIA